MQDLLSSSTSKRMLGKTMALVTRASSVSDLGIFDVGVTDAAITAERLAGEQFALAGLPGAMPVGMLVGGEAC